MASNLSIGNLAVGGSSTSPANSTGAPEVILEGTAPLIAFRNETGGTDDYVVINETGAFKIKNDTDNSTPLTIDSAGQVTVTNQFNAFATNAKIVIGTSGSAGLFGHIGWNSTSNYLYLGHSYGGAFNENLKIDGDGLVSFSGGTRQSAQFDAADGVAAAASATVNMLTVPLRSCCLINLRNGAASNSAITAIVTTGFSSIVDINYIYNNGSGFISIASSGLTITATNEHTVSGSLYASAIVIAQTGG